MNINFIMFGITLSFIFHMYVSHEPHVRMRYYTYMYVGYCLRSDKSGCWKIHVHSEHRINKIKTAKQEEFFVLDQRALLYVFMRFLCRDNVLIFPFYLKNFTEKKTVVVRVHVKLQLRYTSYMIWVGWLILWLRKRFTLNFT